MIHLIQSSSVTRIKSSSTLTTTREMSMKTIFFECVFLLWMGFHEVLIGIFNIHTAASAQQQPNDQTIINACAGEGHMCVVFASKKMKCIGNGSAFGFNQNNIGDEDIETGDKLPFINIGSSLSILKASCGQQHLCVLLSTGDVKCTGDNFNGQIGLETRINNIGASSGYVGDTLPIVNLGTGNKAADIALGMVHSCAIVTGKQVKCYGGNSFGQLGYENTADIGQYANQMGASLPFINFGSGVEISSIVSSSSSYHTCVILFSPFSHFQRIKCWGFGASFQLGYGDASDRGDAPGDMGDSLPLVDLGIESRVKQLALGMKHTCALLINDNAKCWGRGAEGQLGSGTTLDISSTGNSMPFILIDVRKAVKLLAAGSFHSCLVYDDDVTIKCFGSNFYGQLGQGDAVNRGNSLSTTIPNIFPINLGTSFLKIKYLHIGKNFNCVVFEDSSMKCFGQNSFGQFAIGSVSAIGDQINEMGSSLEFSTLFSTSQVESNTPTLMPSLMPTFKKTVVPTRATTDNPTSPSKTPTLPTKTPTTKPTTRTPTKAPVAPPIIPTTGPTIAIPTPSPIEAPGFQPVPATRPIISFCAGANHACAVFETKTLRCWGLRSSWGSSASPTDALGDSPTEIGENIPLISVGTVLTTNDIFCGGGHTCAIINTFDMKCMGNNSNGQIGIVLTNPVIGQVSGHVGPSLPIVNFGVGLKVIGAALGAIHSCVIVSGGKVKCFGANNYGQTGYGVTNNIGNLPNSMGTRLPFVDFGTNAEVASIHSCPFSSHTCVIISAPLVNAQRAKCWGKGNNFQLGYGTPAQSIGSRPDAMGENLPAIDFGAESKVKQIAVGGDHTCALLINNALKCFGLGYGGQLGSGSTTDIKATGDLMPIVSIDTGKFIKKVTAGNLHTCVLYDDEASTVKCFGYNFYGELGQGDTSNRGNSPTTTVPNIPGINLGASNSKISTIYSGGRSNYILYTDYSIKCFGRNNIGQCAIGTNEDGIGDSINEMGNFLKYTVLFAPTKSPTNTPTKNPLRVPTRNPIRVPTQDPTRTPTTLSPTYPQLPATRPITSFCTGNEFACSVFESKSMKCSGAMNAWGQSFSGSVGDSDDQLGDNLPYVDIGNTANIDKISCGCEHICLKFSDSTVKCLGNNENGQIGLGIPNHLIGKVSGHIGANLPSLELGSNTLVLDIAVGNDHSCMLIIGNRVKCVGSNNVGQLGYENNRDIGKDASFLGDNLPIIKFGTDVRVSSIHSGPLSDHTCAILSSPALNAQRIKCWGFNNNFQLGYGDTNNRGDDVDEMGDDLALVDLGVESRVKQLALGAEHTCVLLLTSKLKCYGLGDDGQLGSGSKDDISLTGESTPYVTADASRKVSILGTGGYHTCVVLDDNQTLKCVGNNSKGQLGQGDKTNRGNSPNTVLSSLSAVDLGLDRVNIVSIHNGGKFNCIVFENFAVKCFGSNTRGQLAVGSSSDVGDSPEKMGKNLKFAYLFSPTQSPTKKITQTPTQAPISIPYFTKPILSFCAGFVHSCAVYDSKRLKCWGVAGCWGKAFSLVGDSPGDLGDNLPFVNLGASAQINQVACGYAHTCIQLNSQSMKCMGYNQYGQIGLGTGTNPIGEVSGHVGDLLPIIDLGNGLKVLDMALGRSHTCVKVSGNRVKCFGYNVYGQLGYGNKADIGKDASKMGNNLPFVDLGRGIEVDSLYATTNSHYTCAILSAPSTAAQRFKCWGWNQFFQLGYPDSNFRGDNAGEMGDNLPLVNLGSESRIKVLSLGDYHACAALITGSIKCWGHNIFGQLGSGSTTPITAVSEIPEVYIDAGKKVKHLSVGGFHTCIVYDDELTMKCIGQNNRGQLGQGDDLSRGGSPTNIFPKLPAIDLGTGSLQIKSIYAGNSFNCIIFNYYSVKCFGQNKEGQCAAGTNTDIGITASDMGANLKYALFFSSPTPAPSRRPTNVPTRSPTLKPVPGPTNTPTIYIKGPTRLPTRNPIRSPTWSPQKPSTLKPTVRPTEKPVTPPSKSPTQKPFKAPTGKPSLRPTDQPTETQEVPTFKPSKKPTSKPTPRPSLRPTLQPTAEQTQSTKSPTKKPTIKPTPRPSLRPTVQPTEKVIPTNTPSKRPTKKPSSRPTPKPTWQPTTLPTERDVPTKLPTRLSTQSPTRFPTYKPTSQPTVEDIPTNAPSKKPTRKPTTKSPTPRPTIQPTPQETLPTKSPTLFSTSSPTRYPTPKPTRQPTEEPTQKEIPTNSPTKPTTESPTKFPTLKPTKQPTNEPTRRDDPTKSPTYIITKYPTMIITKSPTPRPSPKPTEQPVATGEIPTKAPTNPQTKSPTYIQTKPPTPSQGGENSIISFCTGYQHTCVVFATKKMKCLGSKPSWGSASGYLGDSPSELGENLPYVNIGAFTAIEKVSCGYYHTCVKTDSQQIKCLGNNQFGQIGIGSTLAMIGETSGHVGDRLPFVDLGKGLAVLDITVGLYHTCAVVTKNKVKCYGHNWFGQLGYENTDNIGRSFAELGDYLPNVALGAGVEVASIISSARGYHTCVILSAPVTASQRIKCWGYNLYYQLGYGDDSNRGDSGNTMGNNLPLIDLGNESRVKQVGVGYGFTCAMLMNNDLKCFGRGLEGQLGSGSPTPITATGNAMPSVVVDKNERVLLFAVGGDHTCIVYDDRTTIKCFGENDRGQLGQGDTVNRGGAPTTMIPNIPAVELGTGTLQIISIFSGNNHNCVIFVDSSIKCFGQNKEGECGVGSSNDLGDEPNEMGRNIKFANLFSK